MGFARTLLSRLPLALLVWAGMGNSCGAEINRDAAARLAVDVVLAEGGRELRGELLSRDREGVVIAVRREWFLEHEPVAYERFRAEEQRQQIAARIETVQRIEEWLAESQDALALKRFLDDELARLKLPANDEDPPSEFVTVTIPAGELRRVFAQSAPKRQLVAAAWELGVDDVEQTRFPELTRKVAQLRPDWETRRVNLSDRLAFGHLQSESEWRARQAIVEHRLGEGTLEFQGTGDVIFPVSRVRPPLEALIAPLVSQQLLPEGGGASRDVRDWKQTAIDTATKAGLRSVRVTRVSHNLKQRTVTVESVLLGADSEETWVSVWVSQRSGSFLNPRPGAQEHVLADPQVQQLAETAKSLGLGQALDEALNAGALTHDLLQDVNDEWFLFSEAYLNRLDGPVLIVPK